MMIGKKAQKNMAETSPDTSGLKKSNPGESDQEVSKPVAEESLPETTLADQAPADMAKKKARAFRFPGREKFKQIFPLKFPLKKDGPAIEKPAGSYEFYPLKEGTAKKGLLERLPKKPGNLIVFESTGMTLYAAIARRGVLSKPEMGKIVRAVDPDPAVVVAKALELLKEQAGKLPKICVFITPFALADIISLPVDPKKKTPAKQMLNMVKYELEELFLSQTEFVDMGSLLQDSGCISMEERKRAEESGRPGDASVFEAIAGKEDLAKAHTLLDSVSELSDDLVTGWAPFGATGEESGSFMWMGAGIDNTIRQMWNRAFAQNKLSCAWYFPRLGVANAMIEPPSEGWLFLDVCQDRFALFDGYGKRIESVSMKPLKHGTVDIALLTEVVERSIRPGTSHIFISFPPFFNQVFEGFMEFFESKNIKVRLAAQGMPGAYKDFSGVYPSMAGACASFFNAGLGVTGLVKIDAGDPPPPVWKSANFWVASLLIVVLCVIVGSETYLNKRANEMEWALELAEMEFKKKMKMKRDLESNFREAEAVRLEYEKKTGTLEEAKRLKDLLENVIMARRNEVPDILEAIGSTVTDEILIIGISEENRRTTLVIQTWSLESSDAQGFAKNLGAALKKWEFHVADTRVTESSFSGIDGYYAEIKIVRKSSGAPEPKGGKK